MYINFIGVCYNTEQLDTVYNSRSKQEWDYRKTHMSHYWRLNSSWLYWLWRIWILITHMPPTFSPHPPLSLCEWQLTVVIARLKAFLVLLYLVSDFFPFLHGDKSTSSKVLDLEASPFNLMRNEVLSQFCMLDWCQQTGLFSGPISGSDWELSNELFIRAGTSYETLIF